MNLIKKKYKYIVIIVSLLIIGIIFIFSNDDDMNIKAKENIIKKDVSKEPNLEELKFYVDLKGAVKNPGVYKVDEGCRIIDVVNLAGGFLDIADNSVINLSKKIKDEMTIIIYTKTQIQDAKNRLIKNSEPTIIEVIKEIEKECNCPDNINNACINEYNDDNNNDKININTATKEELMTLPNIGESRAIDIIEYRTNNKFNIIDDIKNVSGIGDSTFEKLKNLITI